MMRISGLAASPLYCHGEPRLKRSRNFIKAHSGRRQCSFQALDSRRTRAAIPPKPLRDRGNSFGIVLCMALWFRDDALLLHSGKSRCSCVKSHRMGENLLEPTYRWICSKITFFRPCSASSPISWFIDIIPALICARLQRWKPKDGREGAERGQRAKVST